MANEKTQPFTHLVVSLQKHPHIVVDPYSYLVTMRQWKITNSILCVEEGIKQPGQGYCCGTQRWSSRFTTGTPDKGIFTKVRTEVSVFETELITP
jgi:hypothetical protein